MSIEFKLPELGEGVETGSVVKLLVEQGDTISAEQAVMEIEIDKATVELPCPHAGTIDTIHVAVGDDVPVGATLLTLSGADAAAEAPAASPAPAKAPAELPREPRGTPPPTPRQAFSRQYESAPQSRPAAEASPAPAASAAAEAPGGYTPAGPAVRRLARMLGVQLTSVEGSGERGRIRPEDVHAYVKRLAASSGNGSKPLPSLPDFSKWGPVDVEPLSSIRKRTAQAMARAWEAIPHVTQNDLADITELEAGRKEYRRLHPDRPKVTMTVLVAKACACALKGFPDVNSSIDMASGTQHYKRYYHMGIAVDTQYGLLVPVLRDVDKKNVVQLAAELTDLAARTRNKNVKPDELRGATFTISNLGGIGGTSFTPIVNWPQVAILGVSRGRREYQVTENGPRARLMMPLSLSYDHRVIDGAMAARFTRAVAELLSSPTRLLFEI